MASLSTTTMSGLLRKGKFEEMCQSVESFFMEDPDDAGSAIKVVRWWRGLSTRTVSILNGVED